MVWLIACVSLCRKHSTRRCIFS